MIVSSKKAESGPNPGIHDQQKEEGSISWGSEEQMLWA